MLARVAKERQFVFAPAHGKLNRVSHKFIFMRHRKVERNFTRSGAGEGEWKNTARPEGAGQERSALYEIATGIITYFLHGSSRSLIRTTVLREGKM